jgi:hypothetical protein
MATIYKVSYVVIGGDYPGGIVNQSHAPVVGDEVELGRHTFEVTEVQQISPPRDDFQFFHASVKPLEGA